MDFVLVESVAACFIIHAATGSFRRWLSYECELDLQQFFTLLQWVKDFHSFALVSNGWTHFKLVLEEL